MALRREGTPGFREGLARQTAQIEAIKRRRERMRPIQDILSFLSAASPAIGTGIGAAIGAGVSGGNPIAMSTGAGVGAGAGQAAGGLLGAGAGQMTRREDEELADFANSQNVLLSLLGARMG